MIRTLFLILLLAPIMVEAQPTTDEQLAAQYYNNGEFDKARLYYEKLYNSNPSDYYYQFYFETLLELQEFDNAEKLVKKHSRGSRSEERFMVDLGLVYAAMGKPEKAEDEFNDAIESLPNSVRRINDLAQRFVEENMLEYALRTYEYGKKLMDGRYPFEMQIAAIYGRQGKLDLMITAYLDVLENFPDRMTSVQILMSQSIDFDNPESEKAEKLRVELLQRIQENASRTIYTEMLIWMFIQQENFSAALMQAKALDKRKKGSGQDVYSLSMMCRSNKYYDVAVKGFEYIVETYPDGPLYQQAKSDLLSTLYNKVVESSYSQEDLEQLESLFIEALEPQELGRNAYTVPVMQKLARIQAFYLHDTQKALNTLNDAKSIPGINTRTDNELKMDLADVLVLHGDVWEASLLYMQIEKAFKEDVLGHEAKFKNARVFYYTGSFQYAQGQLEVLKASTSKLIANDALKLSLLISDNLNLDTNTRALQLFANADLYTYQNQYVMALASLDTLENEFHTHSLKDEVLFQKFIISEKQRDFDKATLYLEALVEQHPDDILADEALFRLGDIHQYQFHDEEKAAEYYKRIMFDYKGSLFGVEARKRFRAIVGEDTNRPINTIDTENGTP